MSRAEPVDGTSVGGTWLRAARSVGTSGMVPKGAKTIRDDWVTVKCDFCASANDRGATQRSLVSRRHCCYHQKLWRRLRQWLWRWPKTWHVVALICETRALICGSHAAPPPSRRSRRMHQSRCAPTIQHGCVRARASRRLRSQPGATLNPRRVAGRVAAILPAKEPPWRIGTPGCKSACRFR